MDRSRWGRRRPHTPGRQGRPRSLLIAAALAALAAAGAACGGGVETQNTGGSTGGSASSSASSTSSSSSSASSSASSSSGASSSSSTSASSSSSAGSSSSSSSGGVPCHWSEGMNPCPSGQFCNAIGCGDGLCAPLGATEVDTRQPVCGCDGATYWNQSVADSHGMPRQADGACMPAKTCGGFANLPCPPGAMCSYHMPDKATCGASDFGGTCWALPAVCPQSAFGPLTRACGSATCKGECDLIKTAASWYDDPSCPQ